MAWWCVSLVLAWVTYAFETAQFYAPHPSLIDILAPIVYFTQARAHVALASCIIRFVSSLHCYGVCEGGWVNV